jgi:hypothetical protein
MDLHLDVDSVVGFDADTGFDNSKLLRIDYVHNVVRSFFLLPGGFHTITPPIMPH